MARPSSPRSLEPPPASVVTVATDANCFTAPFCTTLTTPARSAKKSRPSGAKASAVGTLAVIVLEGGLWAPTPQAPAVVAVGAVVVEVRLAVVDVVGALVVTGRAVVTAALTVVVVGGLAVVAGAAVVAVVLGGAAAVVLVDPGTMAIEVSVVAVDPVLDVAVDLLFPLEHAAATSAAHIPRSINCRIFTARV